MSKAKTAMQIVADQLIDIFHKYAGQSDDLDKKEFKKMIDEQFPDCVEYPRKQEGKDKLFKDLDKNKNDRISFEEWTTLLGSFLTCSHIKFHQQHGDHHHH
ncbi:protein S100-A12-like [Rhineura floridana]|uniref:protein S100-A12-like n=1 Tax=Rhineura floridana TaxID=261503 RepID=UPI002AC82884|nr:protein S100-A12-like [Rhineura floridana]